MMAIDYVTRYVALVGIAFSAFLLIDAWTRRWHVDIAPAAAAAGRARGEKRFPRPCGLALFPSLILAFLAALYFWPILWQEGYAGLIIAASVVTVVGIYGDLYGLHAVTALSCSALSGLILLHFGYRLDGLQLLFIEGVMEFGRAAPIITVAGTVLVMGAVHWLEALRTGAVTSGMLICALLLFLKLTQNAANAAAPLLIALGSLAALTLCNIKSAKTTLGHGGAMLVGLLMASELLDGPRHVATVTTAALPVVILGLPILDGVRAFRVRCGESHRAVSKQRRRHDFVRCCLAYPESDVFWLCAKALTHTVFRGRTETPAETAEPRLAEEGDRRVPDSARQTPRELQKAVGGKRRVIALTKAILTVLVTVLVFGAASKGPHTLVRDSIDYESSVAAYLASGDAARALRVARIAKERYPGEPTARYLYAKSLMANEESAAALDEYAAVFRIEEIPNPDYDPLRPAHAPKGIDTFRPFFHPMARLEVGDYWLQQGDLGRAIENFELAQAFGQTPNAEWRPTLYAAYSALGAWGAAFEYADPPPDLAALPAGALRTLVRICAYREDWLQCKDAALVWRSRTDADAADADFWLGRARLALSEFVQASTALESAKNAGHPDAPFFLGLAEEARGADDEAAAHFLHVSATSLYRPFSLAKAASLLQRKMEQSRDQPDEETRAAEGKPVANAPRADPARLEERIALLAKELRALLAEAMPLPSPHRQDDLDVRSRGFAIPMDSLAHDAPFPMLIAWRDSRQPPSTSPEQFAVESASGNSLRLRYGRDMLELRWVENLAPFGDLDPLPMPGAYYPGWIERYRDAEQGAWRRVSPFAHVIHDAWLRIRATDAGQRVYCETAPLPVETGRFFLFAVRCKSEGARLVAGWNWYDSETSQIASDNAINQRRVRDWAWETLYERRPDQAAFVQASVGIYRDKGQALFDTVLIVPLDPPTFDQVPRDAPK